ncbi:hypothetical protein [Mycobacteroides abscessus]|uniref:hypothetical protein n=1 Tax=Mycobacteroides abscessus TaxID=36809 RepID=UPI00113C6755|nr:hypothetical protein [Mycobacteroides abscessus]TKV35318.1 hypothetical protein CFA71_23920 [Mycobacteroides abscessus subsp. bolletii]
MELLTKTQIQETVKDMHRALDQCRAAVTVVMDELEGVDASECPASKSAHAGARAVATLDAKSSANRPRKAGNNPYSPQVHN